MASSSAGSSSNELTITSQKKARAKCSFVGCGRSQQTNPDLHFFRFPVKRPKILEQWLINCGYENLIDLPDNVLPLPEDIVVEFLDGSYAEEMDKNWPHKYPGSELCHRENLEKNFGLGLFRKSDKKLVGSALSDYNGGVCVLYCEPEVRGRGLAAILVQRMVQEIRRRGRIPYATVVVGNKPSERVVSKTGFEVFCDVDYIDVS